MHLVIDFIDIREFDLFINNRAIKLFNKIIKNGETNLLWPCLVAMKGLVKFSQENNFQAI